MNARLLNRLLRAKRAQPEITLLGGGLDAIFCGIRDVSDRARIDRYQRAVALHPPRLRPALAELRLEFGRLYSEAWRAGKFPTLHFDGAARWGR